MSMTSRLIPNSRRGRRTIRPAQPFSRTPVTRTLARPTGITAPPMEDGITNQVITTSLPTSRRKPVEPPAKYFETLFTGVSMSTTGAFTSVSAIVQGPSQNERVADTVWLQRLDFSISVATANVDIFNLARVTLLFWDVSSALALPTTAEVFLNWPNALVHSFPNFERRKDYRLLSDLKFNLTGVAASPTSTSQHFYECSIPLNNRRIDFDPAVLTSTGGIYLFLGSDSAAIPFPVFNGNYRLWYRDA